MVPENKPPETGKKVDEKILDDLLLDISSGKENIHKDLQVLPEEMRKKLTVTILDKLQYLKLNEAPKDSFERGDYYSYQRLKRFAEALKVVDLNTYNKENISALLLKRLSGSLRYDAYNDRETYPSDPRERLEYILAKISGALSTMEEITSREEQDIVELTLEEFDGELFKSHKEILPYVQATLKEYAQRSQRFESPKALQDVVEALKKVQEVPLRKEGDYYLYAHEGDKSGWRIEIFGRSERKPDDFSVVVRCVGKDDLFFTLERKTFLLALENKQLPVLVENTLKNRRIEEENRHVEETYDLPKNEPIAHLRVLSRERDHITNRDARTACLSVAVLKSKYPNLRAHPVLFTDNPAADIQKMLQKIREDKKTGTKHVVIDIVSHGLEDHFDFKKPMTAEDLRVIVRDFPEFTFTFKTDACYTAGIERLKDDPKLLHDPSMKRAAFFFASKGDTPYIASQTSAGHVGSTSEFYFLEALLTDKNITFGKAAFEAKIKTSKILPNNGGAIIRGTYIGALLPSKNRPLIPA